MARMAPRLVTTRLLLREFTDHDADELHSIFSDPLTHTIGEGPVTDLEVTREWIRNRRTRATEFGVVWYQRRGYGREAASAVIEEAHLSEFVQVWGTVRSWNAASLAALTAVGFTRDRVVADDRGDLVYLVHRK